MSYEVTATRRRPQKFEDLAGQEFVASTLKNAIQTGKIAHAYLFSGPRGCGKTSSARILAKALNCENGPTPTPCDNCTSCQEITKGSSLDVIEIDGASNTSVNDIRQIKDEVLFPPNSARYKIYIIDEVHMLSTSAFNALLKTIEEPPPYVIFIFATTEIHKVPATIKSRCQQFHFRLGTVEQIKNLLAKAAQEINVIADDEALFWIAREATGSFRDAYTLFDQVVAFSEGHITYDKIRDKLGLVGIERLNEICEFCIHSNSKNALELLDEILANGVSLEQFVTNLAEYFRSLLFIQVGITKESLLNQNIERYSKLVLDTWNKDKLEKGLSLILQLFKDIRYSLNPRYEIELAISRLCWLSNYISNTELMFTLEQTRKQLLGSTPPFQNSDYSVNEISAPVIAEIPKTDAKEIISDNQPQTVIPNNNISVVRNQTQLSIDELKEETIKELSYTNPLLASLISETNNWTLDDNKISTTNETLFLNNQLQSKTDEISDLLSKIWGRKVFFTSKLLKEIQPIEEDVHNPKIVDILCSVFKGTVVSQIKTTPTNNEKPQPEIISKDTNTEMEISEDIDIIEDYSQGDDDEF